MTELNDTLKALGHLFNDSPSGGFGKLFSAWADQHADMTSILVGVRNGHLVAMATGYALDLIGQALRFPREDGELDEPYRDRLQLEIDIRCSEGTLTEIRDIIARSLLIDHSTILIYQNEAPSLGLVDLPYFVEVSVNWGVLAAELTSGLFKFSDDPLVSLYGSDYGFDVGKWDRIVTQTTLPSTILNELLERILATGVQYVIAVHGGFKFSDDPLVSTHASSRGFDTGRLRKRLTT